MRVRLRGLNWTTKRLASGQIVTHWYAWRGGPKLVGEPGSPEFLASYNEAIAGRVIPEDGMLLSVLTKYQQSDNFKKLAERTRKDYAKKLSIIERDFGDLPTGALADKRMRGHFLEWRDKLAENSRRQADYAWQVLATVLAWGLDRALVLANPCERGGKLYRADRVDKVWSDADEALFLERAPKHLHLPLLLALWTGQRQGDLLRLPWTSYDGTFISMRQSKTRVRVTIPVGSPLKAVLDAAAS